MFDLSHPPAGFTENPFPHYDDLLQNTPVCPQNDGSYLICRHADLNAIYRDTTTYISDKKQAFEPKFGAGTPLFEHHTTSLVFNDPPLHTRVRRIMSSALAPKAIQKMEPGLIAIIDQLLDNMPENADLVSDFAMSIPIQIIGNLLDIPPSERTPLRNWSLAILGALEPTLTPAQLAAGHTAVSEFKEYLQRLIADRKVSPGDPETDVLTRLIAGDDAGQLTEIELIQNCIFILNAGHETTTNLIGSGLALLHDFPDQKQRLKNDPSLIDTCVEEILRYRSPNQFGNRETTTPVTLNGHQIPAGTNLHLCIGAANRDPQVFDNPKEFDITRKPNRHLAFAGGPHVCVGLTLARMEGRIALQRFLTRFPDYEVLEGRKTGGRIRFHGLSHLPARLALNKPQERTGQKRPQSGTVAVKKRQTNEGNMRLFTAAMAGAGLMVATMMPAQVAAEAKIYPYHGANYCPAGFQPVQINGVICCGKPNQHMSYSQMLAHPMPKKRHVRKVTHRHTHKKKVVYSARAHCPAGEKGCS